MCRHLRHEKINFPNCWPFSSYRWKQKSSCSPWNLLVYTQNDIFKMSASTLSNWPEVYYPALTQGFNPSSHFIALISLPKHHFQATWIISLRSNRNLPPRKRKTRPYSHMSLRCQFYLFVQIVGLSSQNPVTDLSSKHRPALDKCGVKGSTAGEGSQEIYTLLIRTRDWLKACPDRSCSVGKQQEGRNSWVSWFTQNWIAFYTIIFIYWIWKRVSLIR